MFLFFFFVFLIVEQTRGIWQARYLLFQNLSLRNKRNLRQAIILDHSCVKFALVTRHENRMQRILFCRRLLRSAWRTRGAPTPITLNLPFHGAISRIKARRINMSPLYVNSFVSLAFCDVIAVHAGADRFPHRRDTRGCNYTGWCGKKISVSQGWPLFLSSINLSKVRRLQKG